MRLRETIDWGFDLGTTNSSAAVLKGRDVKVIKNNEGDEITPSAVYEKKAGKSVLKRVGKIAKQKLLTDYEHVALEFKQKMGLKNWYFEFPSTGRKATAVDLSAEVLKELVGSVKQKEGEDIYAALVTVPAAFEIPMYEDTREAGEKAGLRHVEVLEEPIAAALAYGLKPNVSPKGRWLAYDLGGGTFDAALVRVEDGVFSVFDHEGLRNLGGKNLDAAIVERYFVPKLPSDIREKITSWKSPSWWLLKFMAEEAKCQLSTKNEYTIDCTVDGHDFVDTITRKQLDILEAEIFAPTIKKCWELLKRNKFSSKDIERVVLIGGPTLSPHFRKMIEEELGIPVDFSVDPLTAVARGAAIYAAGRKIPDEMLDKILNEIKEEEKVSIHVDLYYPNTTREEEVMVTGKLESKVKKLTISPEWSVEIKRVDKTGKVGWSSGRISISENGGFAKVVPLEEGENFFEIVVVDAKGRQPEIDKSNFSIKVIPVKSDIPKLPRGIGIADIYGEVKWFFKKGSPLPAEKSEMLKTTKELKRGEKGAAINIPVVEGNENKAYLNRVIDTLKVWANKISITIPEDSNVEVTIKMDESRAISVTAYFEDYDVEVSAAMEHDMDITPEKLHKELENEQMVLNSLKKVANEDSEINRVVEEIKKSGMVEDIGRLISQISVENPEPGQQAMDKILELRKKIDPIIEKGDELLNWKTHKEWCGVNIQLAKKIVGEAGDLPSDWLRQFDQLLEDYEGAIRNKDFKRTEEIAYGALPNLFLSSEKLRERVGKDGIEYPERRGIPKKDLGSGVKLQ